MYMHLISTYIKVSACHGNLYCINLLLEIKCLLSSPMFDFHTK